MLGLINLGFLVIFPENISPVEAKKFDEADQEPFVIV